VLIFKELKSWRKKNSNNQQTSKEQTPKTKLKEGKESTYGM
jgi:hypothetical protein